MRRTLISLVLVLIAATTVRADSGAVLVLPFENLTNDRSLDWIGEGIAELVVQRLQPEPGVYAFSREERLTAYEKFSIPETAMVSRATALKLGWDSGADHVVTGSFSGSGGEIHIVAHLVDLSANASIDFTADGKLQDVIPLTMNVAWNLLRRIIPGTASPESDYTARPPTPRSAFENYVRAILTQDLEKRIDLLQTALRLHPQYGPALFQLGRAYHLQRDFAMSNQWLEKIPDSDPDRRQVSFLNGVNYFYLGDYARAITRFQQLPPTYDVLLNLGAAFSRKGDLASAMSAWQRAANINPLANDALFNQGYGNFVKGDLNGAENKLLESLKLRGRDSEALFLLGRTYGRQGRVEESQRLLTQAARLSQRVERWLNQPVPNLERFVTSTTFRSRDEVWNDQRLARRAHAQDLTAWLDVVQTDIDAYLYGEALRELQDVMKAFPDSPEPRSLVTDIERRQRNSR